MAKQKQPVRTKHVPQRTCVACRRVAGKRSLIRLVRGASGVAIDAGGKLPGRGMYLHPNQRCWQIALKSGRIEQALRTKLSAEDRALILGFMQTLPEDEELPEAGTPEQQK